LFSCAFHWNGNTSGFKQVSKQVSKDSQLGIQPRVSETLPRARALSLFLSLSPSPSISFSMQVGVGKATRQATRPQRHAPYTIYHTHTTTPILSAAIRARLECCTSTPRRVTRRRCRSTPRGIERYSRTGRDAALRLRGVGEEVKLSRAPPKKALSSTCFWREIAGELRLSYRLHVHLQHEEEEEHGGHAPFERGESGQVYLNLHLSVTVKARGAHLLRSKHLLQSKHLIQSKHLLQSTSHLHQSTRHLLLIY
jgi:hypothetical protein